MKTKFLAIPAKPLLLILTSLAVLIGAAVAGSDLHQAIQKVQSLYSVGLTGLSIESELVYFTQESRRQFLYALSTGDPNFQLPCIDNARIADGKAAAAVAALRKVESGADVARDRRLFEEHWRSYLNVRDEVISLILEGRPEQAIALDRMQGDRLFGQASQQMYRMKQEIETYGRERTAAIRGAFYRAGLELLLLLATTAVFISVLMRTLAKLARTNGIIARSRAIDQSSNRILEMVGKNESRDKILDALMRDLEAHYPGGKGILSLVDGDCLRISAAPQFADYVQEQVDIARRRESSDRR